MALAQWLCPDLTQGDPSERVPLQIGSQSSTLAALDRLLADGRIEVESDGGPRGKKTYAITDAGREEFRRWMLAELTGADLETAVLARAHFLGLMKAPERSAVAAHIDERIRWDLGRLERLEAQVSTVEVPEGFEDVARYQLATLQYVLASCRTALAWAEAYLPQPATRTTT